MEFHERLRERRQEQGLTQLEVATKIGVAPTTYAHYESGRRTPDIKRLRMLCHLFGIALEDHFPLVRTISYPPELLKTLADARKSVSEELVALKASKNPLSAQQRFHASRTLSDRLKAAMEPVQEIWETAMSAPEMDLSGLEAGQTVMRVNYRPEDWQLLQESLQLQSRIMEFMFSGT